MKILIAPDSFKESLKAPEVANAIQEGLAQALPLATFCLLPIGDGGEGTISALNTSLHFTEKKIKVTGPFGNLVDMTYWQKNDQAMFEVADVVGLEKIPKDKRQPLEINTKGIGELLLYLAKQGIKEVFVGVGGTASHDGGIGLAAGLGYRFFNAKGQELKAVGSSLGQVSYIQEDQVFAGLKDLSVTVLTDVTNPLCGKQGATYVFAEQKGLPASDFASIDEEMAHFYCLVNPDIFVEVRAGAGGGLAAGLATFLNAKLVSGIDKSLDLLAFDQLIDGVDLVIVGEGRLDRQSLAGKTPIGIARRVPKGIPVLAICGSLADDLPDFPYENIKAAFSILYKPSSIEEALKEAKINLTTTAAHIGRLLSIHLERNL